MNKDTQPYYIQTVETKVLYCSFRLSRVIFARWEFPAKLHKVCGNEFPKKQFDFLVRYLF